MVYSETANLSVQPRAGDIFLPFSDQISDVLLLDSHRWSLSEAAGIPKLRLEGGGEWGFYIFPSFSSAHHKHTHTDTHILQKGGLCFSSISCKFYFQTETFERQKVKRGQQIEDSICQSLSHCTGMYQRLHIGIKRYKRTLFTGQTHHYTV